MKSQLRMVFVNRTGNSPSHIGTKYLLVVKLNFSSEKNKSIKMEKT